MPRYLVVQLARFGDLLQTARLMATLAAREGAEVHLCLDKSLESLAKVIYPTAVLHPIPAHGVGVEAGNAALALLGPLRRVFAELKTLDFEEIFSLNYSGLNYAITSLFDPDRVRGYMQVDGQKVRGAWPQLAFRWTRDRRVSLNLVDFWAGFAGSMIAPDKVNPVPEPRGGGVGVVLAGRNQRRSLPAEVLAPLVAAVWQKEGGGEVLLLGTASEKAQGRALAKAMDPKAAGKVRNLAGATDYPGLVQAVSGLDRLITPDTGAMHLAAHLGVPVTAFFLSSAWCFETGPYGAGHTVWQAATPCAPCIEAKPCDHGLKCLGPFANPGFARAVVTEKPETVPPGVMGLKSGFDGLGLTFEAFAGEDAQAEQRKALRAFVARHLNLETGSITPPDPDLARLMYQERDWMVENRW